jgi:hypothetical protein
LTEKYAFYITRRQVNITLSEYHCEVFQGEDRLNSCLSSFITAKIRKDLTFYPVYDIKY